MEVFERMALAVFVVSLVMHLLTFVPGLPLNMEMVWMLHVLTMAVVLAAVFFLVRRRGRTPESKRSHSKTVRSMLLSAVPGWAKVLAVVLIIYAGVNFFLFWGQMDGGAPSYSDGRYYLANRGTLLRELTRVEFERYQMLEVRGFSGHWMAFSFVAWTLLHYVCPLRREKEQVGSDSD